MTKEERFQLKKDKIRKRLLKYTRKAFRMLPRLEKPIILDVGCGTGIPTSELARLSNGEITGIDIEQAALDKLSRRIEDCKLHDRVHALKRSVVDMDFPAGSFDIIWSEGSIYAIGFEKGLREWKRFLKSGGFMVIHDEQGNIEEKLEQITNCGYELVGYFTLSKDIWRTEYFTPLERLIMETRMRDPDDPKLIEELNQARAEVDIFRKNPERNSSAFFVAKKS